ncbi:MAG: hypothetical protein QCH96_02405 [Candidatus Thermoplasmatota archaeon]|nr:hypothetical protein [Candidatus Thermoplasmatota archaeon]
MKKKCPKCNHKAVKLYRIKTVDGKRRWIPTAWLCTNCTYVYHVAQDTLIYKIGGERYQEKFNQQCPNCDKRFYRLYRHINPRDGKQQWIPLAWYCERCKYVWLEENMPHH